MMHHRAGRLALWGILLLACAAPAQAGLLSVQSIFEQRDPARPFDSLSFINLSDPGVKIDRIVIDLSGSAAGLFFDTDPDGPGHGGSSPLAVLRDDGVGLGSVSGNGVAGGLDGATQAVLEFDDFDAGEIFTFGFDVDRLEGDHVRAELFAGTILSVILSGPGQDLTRLFSVYAPACELSATAAVWRQVPPPVIPEPATLGIVALGLGALGLARRRRGG